MSATTVQSLKEEGNQLFLEKNYKDAITKYTAALTSAANNMETASDDATAAVTTKELNDLKTVLHSNRAQCHLELFHWTQALDDASAALQLTRYHAKSLFRAASALFRLSKASGSADLLPQQQIVALHICEVAFKKLPKQNHQQFLPLYEEIVKREKDRYHQTKDKHVHHLNSPNPLLCFVCKAMPRFDVENEVADAPVEKGLSKINNKDDKHDDDKFGIRSAALGIRCRCTAASFCCLAHQSIANEHHRPVCTMMGDLASTAGAGDESPLPFGTGKDPYRNLDFLNAITYMFHRSINRQHKAVEFEQLRQVPRCVGCGFFPARYGCKDCSMVSFCGDGGKCVERGLKNLTKEKTGGRLIKKQNNHTPAVCRALLMTARASFVAFLYPKACYSTYYTILDLVAGHAPGRIQMIKKEKTSSSSTGSSGDNDTSTPFISPEEIMTRCLDLYEDTVKEQQDKEIVNANFLYRNYISQFKKSADQLCEEQESGKSNTSTSTASSSINFDSLIADSYSWPMSLIYGVMKSCPDEARDRLKTRLMSSKKNSTSQTNNNNSNDKQQMKPTSASALTSSSSEVEFDQPNNLVVHIIGAEMEAFALPCFEELMHFFAGWFDDDGNNNNSSNSNNNKKHLINHIDIVCIGPGVGRIADSRKELISAIMKDTCADCKKENLTITFHWRTCLYEEYCEEARTNFARKGNTNKNDLHPPPHPHVCVLFNAGINEYEDEEEEGSTWHTGLKAMMLQPQCISIITSYDTDEAKRDREILRNVLAKAKKDPYLKVEEKQRLKKITVGELMKNPFRSPMIKNDPTRWNGVTFSAQSIMFSVY